MTDYSNALKGSCHCGNIGLKLHTNKSQEELTPRTCQCSLCKKHGASWIADTEGTLELTYKDKTNINNYRFGHKTSDFVVCKNCGVLATALCDVEGQMRAVINIKTMTETNFTAEPIQTVFDAEDVESRLARRAKNWTGQVVVKD